MAAFDPLQTFGLFRVHTSGDEDEKSREAGLKGLQGKELKKDGTY